MDNFLETTWDNLLSREPEKIQHAYQLLDERDAKLQVIDFRNEKEYTKMSLPKSTSFTLDNLFEKEPNKVLSVRHKINVFVADDELTERKPVEAPRRENENLHGDKTQL